MNDLLQSSRQVARAARTLPFDAKAIAATTSREAVEQAIAGFRKAMTPAKKLERSEREADQRTLADIIGSIGLRIRPDFSPEQAKLWTAAMVQALDDKPMRIALAAARDAVHHPIQFPGEVLAVICEKAETHFAEYRIAMNNLNRILREFDRPKQQQLEASTEAKAEAQRISDDELQNIDQHLRSLGLSGGWLIEGDDGRIRYASDEEYQAHQHAQNERRFARARGAA